MIKCRVNDQTIQQEHLQCIRDLEREIMTLRSCHTEKIQELKSAFLREKQECQQNAEKKIADMSKQANQASTFVRITNNM